MFSSRISRQYYDLLTGTHAHFLRQWIDYITAQLEPGAEHVRLDLDRLFEKPRRLCVFTLALFDQSQQVIGLSSILASAVLQLAGGEFLHL